MKNQKTDIDLALDVLCLNQTRGQVYATPQGLFTLGAEQPRAWLHDLTKDVEVCWHRSIQDHVEGQGVWGLCDEAPKAIYMYLPGKKTWAMEHELDTGDLEWLIKAMPKVHGPKGLDGLAVFQGHLVAANGQILNALTDMPTDQDQILQVLNLDSDALGLALGQGNKKVQVKIHQGAISRSLYVDDFVFLDPSADRPFERGVNSLLTEALGQKNFWRLPVHDLKDMIRSWPFAKYAGLRTVDSALMFGPWTQEKTLVYDSEHDSVGPWFKYVKGDLVRAIGPWEYGQALVSVMDNGLLTLARAKRLSLVQSIHHMFPRL